MNKMFLKTVLSSALLISMPSYAGFGISASVGSSDYDLTYSASYDSGSTDGSAPETEEQVKGTSFIYTDLTLDYSVGAHQIGIKVGGLGNESLPGNYTAEEAAGNFTEASDLERDEFSIFYTYRLDSGFTLTAGYYDSEVASDYSSAPVGEGPWNGYSESLTIDNSGYFFGVAYGKSFTERLGGFVRAGYQISEVDLTLNGAETYDAPFDQFDYDATGVATVDGKATVLGAGLFYALGENMSVTLYYDLKSFSYDDYQFAFDDGFEPEGQSRFDEDQSTIGLTLRYSF